MDTIDVGLLIIRSWVGLAILLHGVNHARSLDGTANWFASIGFRSAKLQAINSAIVEIGAGALLIIGLGTSPAAAGIFATMFVAFWTVHRSNGFFIFRPGEGYEYVAREERRSTRRSRPPTCSTAGSAPSSSAGDWSEHWDSSPSTGNRRQQHDHQTP